MYVCTYIYIIYIVYCYIPVLEVAILTDKNKEICLYSCIKVSFNT